ncbi:TfpX/TfpZ family type IV pilin accessory protein [Acinetobacter sp. PK01]|uniref:TfpX/TfpZ family type IV pilin accessory protein n=1 Tax=Acinetobacter sp. PK01 TaxID=2930198 RepID=UPI001FB754E5|nr:TfpX/TfpZ family type IV pilin accessory protein [Acinetobacter sp. PK01]UOG17842.1 type4 fimbrial accessory protein [Acinetobacter sp. PK01]
MNSFIGKSSRCFVFYSLINSTKPRLKIALLHFLFSVVLLCIALFLVFKLWYPYPLNIAMGVNNIYVLLLIVDLIIGPLLTFIVYKENKRKLRFDLIIILILQLSAYTFGLYIVAQGRPLWQVFVVDDIELVSPIDINTPIAGLNEHKLKGSFFSSPLWVSAVYSEDPEIRKSQKEDEMFEGVSLATRPETYHLLNYRRRYIVAKLKTIGELKKFNSENNIRSVLQSYNGIYGWLPVKAFNVDMVALFNSDGEPIAIVNLRPWL